MQVKILERKILNNEIQQFVLEKPWDFKAGQYTAISFQGKPYYYSIASSPLDTKLELDIQNSAVHPLDTNFVKFLKQAKELELSQPTGNAFLHHNERPLILIAGGSGIAPMKSIANTVTSRKFYLYWGVRNRECFFDLQGLSYIPVLSDEVAPGFRTGLVHEAVLEDFDTLAEFDIYLAGPFPMSFAAREAFIKKGARLDQLYSDAFAFG